MATENDAVSAALERARQDVFQFRSWAHDKHTSRPNLIEECVVAVDDRATLAGEVERLRTLCGRLRDELDLSATCALMQAHRAFWLNHALREAGHELPSHLEDALIETFDGCWGDDGDIVKALPEERLWPNGRPETWDPTPPAGAAQDEGGA